MLEAKYYSCIDMVFSFICRYWDRATGYFEGSELIKVNTMYSALLLEYYSKSSKLKGKLEAWRSQWPKDDEKC